MRLAPLATTLQQGSHTEGVTDTSALRARRKWEETQRFDTSIQIN